MPDYQKNKDLSEGLTPGAWNVGSAGAVFSCPICGHVHSLQPYAVSGSGAVTPKFKCAAEGCAFTEDIVLSGWGA